MEHMFTEKEWEAEETLEGKSSFNGYKEAFKIDKIISQLLMKFLVSLLEELGNLKIILILMMVLNLILGVKKGRCFHSRLDRHLLIREVVIVIVGLVDLIALEETGQM